MRTQSICTMWVSSGLKAAGFHKGMTMMASLTRNRWELVLLALEALLLWRR
jgi:hypothetical protein